ncbi:AMP-binding protein [Planosporangium thailandense]|uniref:AMP-binding protein n=1 Tax=Planosporangium thailandense TaxID=765197 RepID=A0ABX0Y5Y3_9ACTN|nr:AMP-binding protein [Planosporangium thailandense]NJC73821.1 AMP-binding protein [Planosporangium thailandense]
MVAIVTAAESEAAQRRVAGALAATGLRAGDRVALLLGPSPGLIAVVLGALRRGVIPVVLDPALPAAERAALLADCRPALTVEGPAGLDRLLAGPPADLAPAPLGRPMHYTSGTTGRRKGVWSGVLDPDAARALLDEEVELWGFDADDRHLVFSPLHHSAPLRFAMCTLLRGGTVILPGRFEPTAMLDVIARHRPTTAFCVPTQLRRLFAAADAGPGLPPLTSFRLLAHAGEPCPYPLKRRTVDAFPPASVFEFYGSTEGQFTTCSAAEWAARPGSVGRARPGRVLRVDGDGVIWCRVPAYARFSYWDDPAKTATAWRGDEFTVGDVGRLDPDGYLYLDGRRDDLVITGGVNVYPREVELVLVECPGVEEVAVFGVPDERWGQRLAAAVVGSATVESLDRYARERLTAARRPKDYYVVADLPRTTTGKVRRLDLPGHLGLTPPA